MRRFLSTFGGMAVLVFMVIGLAGCGGGNGKIDFGSAMDSKGENITHAQTTFGTSDKEVAWIAHLKDTVDKNDDLKFVTISPSGSQVYSHTVTHDRPDNVGDVSFQLPTSQLGAIGVNTPGKYTIRYVFNGKVLAKGTFTWTGGAGGTSSQTSSSSQGSSSP